jgi:hypothetical protein
MNLEFPRSCTFLERTKLSYINLAGLLTDGKRDRTARVPGYVSIFLGDICYLIFLRAGEPFFAGTIGAGCHSVRPLAEVVRLAAEHVEHGETGWIGYYGAPDAQLLAMLATLANAPADLIPESDLSNPDRLFPCVQESGFSGVAELTQEGRVHYLCFENGSYRGGYFTGRGPEIPAGEFIRAMFCQGEPVRVGLFPPLDEMPKQAPPALVALYRTLVWSIAQDAGSRIGVEQVVDLLERSREESATSHPVLRQLGTCVQLGVHGEPVADGSVLTTAVATWVTGFLGHVGDHAPIDPIELIERHSRDGRFVLSDNGFFAQLPWPISV